jgi:hypothetical protein
LNITDFPLAFFLLLLAVFVALAEIGFRIGVRSQAPQDETKHKQIEETRTQIAVLLSLLLGFTLSMSLARFDHRKELVIDEANSIGTTYLRAQMLPEPARSQSMRLLRRYIDLRLSWINSDDPQAAIKASIDESKKIQDQLWQIATPLAQQTPNPIISIYAQTLNDMIDLHEKRMAASENRIPNTIWGMLVLLGVVTCFTVGLGQRRRMVVSMIVPPLVIAVVMALVADIDSPRSGSIKVSQGSLMRLHDDLNAAPANPAPPAVSQ